MTEYVYCAVNKDGKIQWVEGSSKRTRYFKTDRYLPMYIEYHNHFHDDDPWKMQKFVLMEVE